MKLFGWGGPLIAATMLAGRSVLWAQTTEVATWSGLYNALQVGGDYKLTASVKKGTGGGEHGNDALVVPKDATVTLSLNGMDVEDTGESSVFTVRGVLVVKDLGDEASVGKITGGMAENGGGVCITDGGSFTMEGGKITGNTATYDGGGVYVTNGVFP